MNWQAFIFDFDGVIVDSEPLHHQAFVRVFDPIDLTLSWERYYDHYLGYDDRDVIRERFKEAGRALDEATLAELMRHKANRFVDIIEQEGVTPYPGVVEFIRAASEKVPVAICSGALRSDIEPVLRILGITGCISELVTADQVHVSKPDPESYRLAFQRLHNRFPDRVTQAERCLAIEDTPAGIAAARGAGLHVVAVTNTYGSESLSTANRVIKSLQGLDPTSI